MSIRIGLGAALVALGLLGCGPAVEGQTTGEDTDGGSSSAGSASASGGSGATTGATSGSTTVGTTAGTGVTTSAGSDTVGSSTGGLTCEEYFSEPEIGPGVEFQIVNDTDGPLFFSPGGCGGYTPLQLQYAGEFVSFRPDECFPSECEAFLGQNDCAVGCPDCAEPPTIRIEPGGLYRDTWSGVSYTRMEMSAECAQGLGCQTSCQRADQAADGTYVASVQLFAGCTGECDCDPGFMPGPDGDCMVGWDSALDNPLDAQVSFEYPTMGPVEVSAN